MKMEDMTEMEASMAAQMAQGRRETAHFENIDIIVKWQKKLDETNRENQALKAEVHLLQHENYFLGIGLQEVQTENTSLKAKLQPGETPHTPNGTDQPTTTTVNDPATLSLALLKTEEKYKSSKRQIADWWTKYNALATDYNRLVEDSNLLKRKYKQKKSQLKALVQAAQYLIANEAPVMHQHQHQHQPYISVHESGGGGGDGNAKGITDGYGPGRKVQPGRGFYHNNGRGMDEKWVSRRDVAPLEITKIAPLQVRKGKYF